MKAVPKEIVYVNGGKIYKSPTPIELNKRYMPDEGGDTLFPFKKVDGKRYLFTTKFRSFATGGEGISLAAFDLCPAVTLWICLGAPTVNERENYDLYFAVDSAEQLQIIADYYKLPFPATDKIMTDIKAAPENYSFWNANGRAIVPGGVKFEKGKPVVLKLYTYPKLVIGGWDIWMYGSSWFKQGTCFESGAIFTKQTGGKQLPGAQMRNDCVVSAEVIYTKRIDGICTSYSFVERKDPVLSWQGNELDSEDNVVRIKYYESSAFVRYIVAGMNTGPTYDTFDLCPDILIWLGRSWYDDNNEQELLFAVTAGSNQLDRIAKYYDLPIPYSDTQKLILNTTPELYRARHYDLYSRGDGGYAPIIVASIVFLQNKPIRLLFYTFMRQWEFEEQIELPALPSLLSKI